MDEKAQKISGLLEEVNLSIKPYKLGYVSPSKDVELLERNARYMTNEQLARLTENVKDDGFLSQLPFCVKLESGKYKVLSGNHRVKAAIKAKLEYILILFADEKDLPRGKQIAMQLAHNAISGQDDKKILASLYFELDELALKEYTGLNEQELIKYDVIDFSGITDADIKMNEISLLFCDEDITKINQVVTELEKLSFKSSKFFIWGDVDVFIKTITEIKRKCEIKNTSMAFLKMVEICDQWLEDNKETE